MKFALNACRLPTLALLTLMATPSVLAAGFPERPLRLIAASAVGGGTDIIARLLAQRMTERWGQQVIVDNRPGGGGVIATDITAKSVPDGHTLLLQSVGISFAPSLYKNLPFDVTRDITTVTIIGTQPFVLAVHPSLPVKSVADLVAFARAKPGSLHFASGGVGGAAHLGGELLRVTAGIDIVHVPFKGTGPGTTALLGGEVQIGIAGVGTLLPHARAGKVRALAVTGAKRSPAAPDLPTVAESGLPGYAFDVWYGVFAAAQTPRLLLSRINKDINATLLEAETVKQFFAFGVDVIGGSVEDSNRFLRAEIARWAKVIREAGIKAE
jgi:tripartite-type tricarboxylate transporter receptor subunit TctC